MGTQIGTYRIERQLGQGGFGVVYVGVDTRLGRRAAIKQLLPELSGQREIVERFFNEAKAAASINHPGIVEIYDVGWHTDGSAYFAMKLLAGDSLAKRLQSTGPMQFRLAATIARQVSSALVAAHACGIVHRDLKPDNIILVPDDEVAIGVRATVLDFGIAKLIGDKPLSQKTRTGMMMGTPSYMSPEQCRGAGEVDHRTDIYALGCMLFEMIAGRPPFVGEGLGEVLGKHQFVDPPRLRSLRSEIPEALEAVVMRALAKQPDQRMQQMAELTAALQPFAAAGAVSAEQPVQASSGTAVSSPKVDVAAPTVASEHDLANAPVEVSNAPMIVASVEKPNLVPTRVPAQLAHFEQPNRIAQQLQVFRPQPSTVTGLAAHEHRVLQATTPTKSRRVLAIAIGGCVLAATVVVIVLASQRSGHPTIVNPDGADARVRPDAALGIEELAAIARAPVSETTMSAQTEAIRALGKSTNPKRAVEVLLEIIKHELPSRREADALAIAASYKRAVAIKGSAIDALAELHVNNTVGLLIPLVYREPALLVPARRAIVASGPDGRDALLRILQHKDPSVNQLFAEQKLDRWCAPDAVSAERCKPLSAMDYFPALLLGDFHDPRAVPDLLVALKRPPKPAFYIGEQPGPSQYAAIFDALRKIGSPEAASPLRAIWINRDVELSERIMAVAAYAFVARDGEGTTELAAIATDNAADDQLRIEAALALARLSAKSNDVGVFQTLAQKYFDASVKKRKELGNPNASSDADRYLGFARLFQTHIARIVIALRCKDDVDCYGASLTLTTPQVDKYVAEYIPDLDTWTAKDKNGLVDATVERAMIELGKFSGRASALTPLLLRHITDPVDTKPQNRSSILLALPKIAAVPCETCIVKLDAAIAEDEGKPDRSDLIETKLLRSYFEWAGGRNPH